MSIVLRIMEHEMISLSDENYCLEAMALGLRDCIQRGLNLEYLSD